MTVALTTGKTELGGLEFHLAGAACYVPFFMINYIAPVLFLVMEPKEHRPVRFHAVQSLLFTAGWLVGIFATTFLSVLLPVAIMLIGAAVGMEDVGALVGVGVQLLATLLLFAVSFGGLAGFLLLAVLTAAEKDPRIPLLASLADRVVGPALA